MTGGHGHIEGSNKKIALLVAVPGGLRLIGAAFTLLGFFAPTLAHL